MFKKRTRSLVRLLVIVGAGVFVLGSLGCAPSKLKAGDDGVVCERVMPTGSHIPRTYCYKAAQAKDRRENDQEKVRNIQIGSGLKLPDPPQPTGN